MAVQSLGQARARDAWGVVGTLVAAQKIGSEADHAKKLPMRIRTAGLAQSLAFLRAKDYAPTLRRELSRWVLGQMGKPCTQADSLLELVIMEHSGVLRRATTECLAWLEWFNRFAEQHRKEEKAKGGGRKAEENGQD